MSPRRDEFSTEDLARASDGGRGRGDERVSGREDAPTPRPMGEAAAPRTMPPGSQAHAAPQSGRPEGMPALFPRGDAEGMRARWTDIQAGFVDQPRAAVQQADALVAETMRRLAEVFARERAELEHQWDRGDQVTTEDLRVALQRYRSFFDRLLSL